MVAIKRDDPMTKTEGGVYIPTTAQMKACRGTVVAVHNGRTLATGTGLEISYPDVTEGDAILFREHAGMEITIDNQDLLIMEESEIIAIMEESEEVG